MVLGEDGISAFVPAFLLPLLLLWLMRVYHLFLKLSEVLDKEIHPLLTVHNGYRGIQSMSMRVRVLKMCKGLKGGDGDQVEEVTEVIFC